MSPANDFVVAAQGRVRFRPDDLAALAALVDALHAAAQGTSPKRDV